MLLSVGVISWEHIGLYLFSLSEVHLIAPNVYVVRFLFVNNPDKVYEVVVQIVFVSRYLIEPAKTINVSLLYFLHVVLISVPPGHNTKAKAN